MGLVGATVKFRMVLNTHMEGTIPQLHGFHQAAIRGDPTESETCKHSTIVIIKFIAVPVPLVDQGGTILSTFQ